MVAESWFDAMGSEAHVIGVGESAPELVAAAEMSIRRLEGLWSRFIRTSEVSRLNSDDGPRCVSRETLLLMQRSLEGWNASGGRFDPTLVGEIVGLGYDENVAHRDREGWMPQRSPGPDHIRIASSTDQVSFDDGVRFDPGGIGKGLAADLVVDEMMAGGAEGACVNIGGDLRVAGASPDGEGWTIEVDHPLGEGQVGVIVIGDGAVATSSRASRRWFHEGELVHHLIDPRTGRPVSDEIVAVTVLTTEGWWAEVVAKAAFVAGPEDALLVIEEMGAIGLMVTVDGSILATERMKEYML